MRRNSTEEGCGVIANCGTGLQCAGKVLCYSAEELTAMRRGGVIAKMRTGLHFMYSV